MRNRNPDILPFIANLSTDVVFTPPEFAGRMFDTLADFFDVERVLVPRAVKNTANPGAATSMDYVWGKHAFLCYITPAHHRAASPLNFPQPDEPGGSEETPDLVLSQLFLKRVPNRR